MPGGDFTADPGALRAQAQQFFSASQSMAQLAGSLAGAGQARTGDGGLDGLIASRVTEVETSASGAGMAMEADGGGLLVNAENYLRADQASTVTTGP
jgi:hypothetical protein